MTEWGVVGVVIALVGLVAAVCGPVVKLSSIVTRLTTMLDSMEQRRQEDMNRNTENHARIWQAVDEHSGKLADHETRIGILEHEKKEDANG